MSYNIETNRQNFNIDWRAEKDSYNEQIEHFCMNEEFADINFVFNRNGTITKIPAHKFAIAVASEVFQKELSYGDGSEEAQKRSKTLQEIDVKDPNVEPDALRTVLHFIYKSYKDVSLSGDSVMAVLYVAKKYLIRPLIRQCEAFLFDNLSAENVFTVLQYTIDCESDKKLKDKCAEIICAKTKDVLESEGFLKISSKCLEFLLAQNSLNASEAELFNAAIRWAKSAKDGAEEKSNLSKGEKLRLKLGAVIGLIRFATMSLKEFAEFVVPSGLLNAEEQRDMMLMIGGQEPVGQPICEINWPRGEKWNFDSTLEGKSYQIATQIQTNKTQFRFPMMIRIENFPSFVISKAHFNSKRINAYGTEWFIQFKFYKYCETSKEDIYITPSSSDQPETLGVFVCGIRSDRKECSFDVDKTFKFKQPSTARERRYSTKYCFNSTNHYVAGWGYRNLARINDILDECNGYLVDNTLELRVDVTISECE